jgi:hypothetical protein
MVLRILFVVDFLSEFQECLLAVFVLMVIFIRTFILLEANLKELAIMKNKKGLDKKS